MRRAHNVEIPGKTWNVSVVLTVPACSVVRSLCGIIITYMSTHRPLVLCTTRKFQLLKSFPNVLISPHSAFLTTEALANIAATTVENLKVTQCLCALA